MNTLTEQIQHDFELARKIRERIKWDKRVSLADLDVVVRGGVVYVSGYVDTSCKKNAALDLISDTDGVREVEDRIVVPADYYRTDEEIANILEFQIAELVKVSGEHIEVDVIEGIVKLDGEVFRPRLKAMAVSLAWELSGVQDVMNLIEIIDPPRRIPLSINFEFQQLSSDFETDLIEEDNLKEVS